MIRLDLQTLPTPRLEFGGAGDFRVVRQGLLQGGPFDLRFGAARKKQLLLGLVGPKETVELMAAWVARCQKPIPAVGPNKSISIDFPGSAEVFKAQFETAAALTDEIDTQNPMDWHRAQQMVDKFARFEAVLRLFEAGVQRLAQRDIARPDVILCGLSDWILANCRRVDRRLSEKERKALERSKRLSPQLDLFLGTEEADEVEENLLQRDFRRALKARCMRFGIPIQICTPALLVDGHRNEEPATRAWNFNTAVYYKAGGLPWRIANENVSTCFVGITFHHFRTNLRHLVRSSLAQAFSSDGEGFAIRGEPVPIDSSQGRHVHLSTEQAYSLGSAVIREYRNRAGATPTRLVLHKTSAFDDDEKEGFDDVFSDIPVVEYVHLLPTNFRLVRFGAYPPSQGTLCSVNDERFFFFTSGFVPELGTYPGPHIPRPWEIRISDRDRLLETAGDIYALTKVNWNSTNPNVSQPVTLGFSRRIGGVLQEVPDEQQPQTSFRFYI